MWDKEEEFKELLRRAAKKATKETLDVLAQLALEEDKHGYKHVCALLIKDLKELKAKHRLKVFYALSAIVRHSVAKRGKRDKYVPRLEPQLDTIGALLAQAPAEHLQQMQKVLNLWWHEEVFGAAAIAKLQQQLGGAPASGPPGPGASGSGQPPAGEAASVAAGVAPAVPAATQESSGPAPSLPGLHSPMSLAQESGAASADGSKSEGPGATTASGGPPGAAQPIAKRPRVEWGQRARQATSAGGLAPSAAVSAAGGEASTRAALAAQQSDSSQRVPSPAPSPPPLQQQPQQQHHQQATAAVPQQQEGSPGLPPLPPQPSYQQQQQHAPASQEHEGSLNLPPLQPPPPQLEQPLPEVPMPPPSPPAAEEQPGSVPPPPAPPAAEEQLPPALPQEEYDPLAAVDEPQASGGGPAIPFGLTLLSGLPPPPTLPPVPAAPLPQPPLLPPPTISPAGLPVAPPWLQQSLPPVPPAAQLGGTLPPLPPPPGVPPPLRPARAQVASNSVEDMEMEIVPPPTSGRSTAAGQAQRGSGCKRKSRWEQDDLREAAGEGATAPAGLGGPPPPAPPGPSQVPAGTEQQLPQPAPPDGSSQRGSGRPKGHVSRWE